MLKVQSDRRVWKHDGAGDSRNGVLLRRVPVMYNECILSLKHLHQVRNLEYSI